MSRAGRKTTAGLHPDGRDAHNIPAGDLMNKKDGTTMARTTDRTDVKRQIRDEGRRVRTAAHEQHVSFNALKNTTGLPLRKFIRVWFGLNPAVWALVKTTDTLGIEPFGGAR